MKKNILLTATILAALAGCTSNDQFENVKQGTPVTISAGIQSPADSRVTYESDGATSEGFVVNWESTDGLTAYASSKVGTFSSPTIDGTDKHKATFTGTFTPDIAAGDVVYAYVNRGSNVTIDASAVTVDLSSQAGTKDDAALRDVMFASGTYQTTGLSLTFAHKMSFLKLVLTFPDTETGTTVSNITLKGTGLYKSVAFNTTNPSMLSASAEGSITIPSATITAHKATVYVCVYPGSLSNVTAYATVGTNAYTFAIQGATAKALTAGKTYTINRANPTLENLSETATKFAGGTGKVDAPFLISNLAELKYLAEQVKTNAYSTSYFKLTNDIYLGDGSVAWTQIGSNLHSFRGTFDGQGHTISGIMKMDGTPSSEDGFGLFGNILDSKIMNINNISSVSTINSNVAKSHLGSIVGRASGNSSIINCHNSGDIVGNSANIGGIVGFLYTTADQSLIVEGCSNSGNIESGNTLTSTSTYLGGIIGGLQLYKETSCSIKIIGCLNMDNSITYSNKPKAAYVGGLIGNVNNNLAATNCNIVACWSSVNSMKAGGKGLFVSVSKNATYTNCYAKTISGITKLINSTTSDVQTNCDTFTTLTPSAAQIGAMNTAWGSATYQFDANGNIVSK